MSELSRIPQTQFDRLERYYLEGANLSDQDLEVCKRLEVAFALLVEHKYKSVVVKKMMDSLGGSQTQCYRDLALAERIFAPMRKYQKEFVRMVTIESAMRDIEAAEKLAKEALKDPDDPKHGLWKTAMAAKDRAEIRLIRASGIENDDPERPNYDKLQPSQFIIDMPEIVKGYFKESVMKGRVDMNKMYNDIVEAEIVKDGESSTEV